MRKACACVLSVFLAGFLALPAAADGSKCNDPFEPVMGGGHSGVRDAKNLVITTETEWCAFWDEVYSILYPPPPCDSMGIDFENEAALVVALGSRPNLCYGVNIYCVHRGSGSDNRVVFYRELIPDEACLCLPVATRPYHVVKVPKPVGNVNFVGQDIVYSCE